MKHQILKVRLQQNVGIAWVKEKLTQMQQKTNQLSSKKIIRKLFEKPTSLLSLLC